MSARMATIAMERPALLDASSRDCTARLVVVVEFVTTNILVSRLTVTLLLTVADMVPFVIVELADAASKARINAKVATTAMTPLASAHLAIVRVPRSAIVRTTLCALE